MTVVRTVYFLMFGFIFQSTIFAKGGMLLHGTVHVILDAAAAVLSAWKIHQRINKCDANLVIFHERYHKTIHPILKLR